MMPLLELADQGIPRNTRRKVCARQAAVFTQMILHVVLSKLDWIVCPHSLLNVFDSIEKLGEQGQDHELYLPRDRLASDRS